MDFETLALAKTYTNQQVLNNGQGNSDSDLLFLICLIMGLMY